MATKKIRSQIRAKIRWGIVGIFALLIVTSFYDAPAFFNRAINKVNSTVALGLPNIPESEFALGLDLQGGAHLVYEADTIDISPGDRATAVEGVRDVIERRVNGLGVGEPSIQTTKVGENYRIIVELPGVTDVNQAITMIGETPILEFFEENNTPARELTPEEQVQIDGYNADAEKRAEEVLAKVNGGADFGEVAKENSEHEFSANNDGYFGFIRAGGDNALYDWASKASDGDLSKTLVRSVEGFNIVRRAGERDGEGSVEASHILVCYLGAERCDAPIYTKTEAAAKAQELFDEANAENFADLVEANSSDTGSKANGGSLGVFGRGVMTPAFEEAAFSAAVGQIVGPVETEFGYHVIYKTDEVVAKEYELYAILIRVQSALDILPPQDPFMPTGLSGSQLDKAEVVTDPNTGSVQVSLVFDREGRELFSELTTRNVNKPIAIYLDGAPISIPTVQQPITDGRAVITGNFTIKSAQLLSQRLNAGALPVPVDLVSQQSVGASLGAESLEKSLKAGIVGLILIIVFMVLYYRLPGLLSVIALSLYLSLTLAVFKLVGVTLTLAGIAGFILSIGLAVDANVLIFERLKEELKEGKSLKLAVEEGFLRAWTSIRDGNISTLITCALLIWFGSSFVQGFAVSLAIGVLMSMFSAITVSRVLLRFVVPWFAERGSGLFLGVSKLDDSK